MVSSHPDRAGEEHPQKLWSEVIKLLLLYELFIYTQDDVGFKNISIKSIGDSSTHIHCEEEERRSYSISAGPSFSSVRLRRLMLLMPEGTGKR